VKVKLKRAFGAMSCDVNKPVLATAVCVVVSLFSQLTVVPTVTVMGLGAYAVVVSKDAPLTMVIDVLPAGAFAGVPEGDVLLPHAEMKITDKRIAQTRRDMMVGSLITSSRKDVACPPRCFSSVSPLEND
jgi:hypothetical protein